VEALYAGCPEEETLLPSDEDSAAQQFELFCITSVTSDFIEGLMERLLTAAKIDAANVAATILPSCDDMKDQVQGNECVG